MSSRLKALLLGIVASFFFSSTFFVNRWLSLGGEHWAWTASLRFLQMAPISAGVIYWWYGYKKLCRALTIFRRHWLFWILAGTVGYGFFYFPLALSSVYVDGWITSSTWQLTIVASWIVVLYLGRDKLSLLTLALSSVICVGVFLVNFEHTIAESLEDFLLGTLPVIGAAFAYPMGNQMVKRSTDGGYSWWVPAIEDNLVNKPLVQVFLMTLGSLPFWVVFMGVFSVSVGLSAPPISQVIGTCLVAILSGVVATSVLYEARHNVAESSYSIVMVDATQSGEIVFTLLLELIFLQIAMPDLKGWIGLLLIAGGMAAYGHATERGQNDDVGVENA